MKRAGFTMIELIFVIVILGILSAVALPKFIGVSEQAEAGKCRAFVGTLNRTVGPALWSDSLMNGNGGKISSGSAPYNSSPSLRTEINKQIDVPPECDNDSNTTYSVSNVVITIGDAKYDANFTEGNATTAPTWSWTKQ